MDKGYEREALLIARRVFTCENRALDMMCSALDKRFAEILNEIMNCKGKIIVTGMGKSGHVARKVAATMASLGTCAIFLHPGECMHGDLGMIQRQDIVIAYSHSGESNEIIKIIPNIRMIGSRIIGITSNENSTLAKLSNLTQVLPNMAEACHLGLAPTSSTTVHMVYGDALAVAASELKGFEKRDFGAFHPSGSLGKSLTIRVIDIMSTIQADTLVSEDNKLVHAIISLERSGFDFVPVTDKDGRLTGIITNGAVERCLLKNADVYATPVIELINRFPIFIDEEVMAVEALKIMVQESIHAMPVVRGERVKGVISKDKIMSVGIYI